MAEIIPSKETTATVTATSTPLGGRGQKVSIAKSSIDKTWKESKKWRAMIVGVIAGLLVYFSALVGVLNQPGAAASIVSLANVAVVFLGSMISVLITGQSVVDWKNYATLESVATTSLEQHATESNTKTEEVRREDVHHEELRRDEVSLQIDPEILRVIQRSAEENRDDPSYMPPDYLQEDEDLDAWRDGQDAKVGAI